MFCFWDAALALTSVVFVFVFFWLFLWSLYGCWWLFASFVTSVSLPLGQQREHFCLHQIAKLWFAFYFLFLFYFICITIISRSSNLFQSICTEGLLDYILKYGKYLNKLYYIKYQLISEKTADSLEYLILIGQSHQPAV